MSLNSNQVYIKHRNRIPLPTDNSFIVTVGFLSVKQFGKSITHNYNTGLTTLSEAVTSYMFGQLSIDIYGNTNDVITRKEEIIQAFSTTKAKQTMTAKAFTVGADPVSVTNLSELDGSSIPCRFNMVFNIQYQTSKTTSSIDFYSTYRDIELKTEQ